MSLSAIFDAVNAAVLELAPTVTFGKTGSDVFSGEAVPPRIVWVPGHEDFDALVTQGGDGISNPRPLWRRLVNVKVHLWAAATSLEATGSEHDAAVEDLMNVLVSSVHDIVGPGGYAPVGGDWIDTEAYNKAGSAYELMLRIYVPVTHAADATSTMGPFAFQPQMHAAGE
jgi:hypothetical protein